MTTLGYYSAIMEKDLVKNTAKMGVKIQMTWGGGMGGTAKAFYGFVLEKGETEFLFHDVLKNEDIKLSYNFKVYERPVKIVTSTVLHGKLKYRYVYALNRDEDFEFGEKYISDLERKEWFAGRERVPDNQDY